MHGRFVHSTAVIFADMLDSSRPDGPRRVFVGSLPLS
jgi:hypothetical protein